MNIEVTFENARDAWPWASRVLAAQLNTGSQAVLREFEAVVTEMLTDADLEEVLSRWVHVAYNLVLVVYATEAVAEEQGLRIDRLELMRRVFDDAFALRDELEDDDESR